METKRCSYCAEEILVNAIKCKHCGSEVKKPPSAIVIFGGGFLFLFFAVVIYTSFTSPSPQGGTSSESAVAAPVVDIQPSVPASTPAKRLVYKTTAVQLFLDYQKNEVATDERIGAARVEITGVIKSIDKDFMGNPTLKLDIDEYLNSVILTLDKAEILKAGELSQGETVTALCDKVERIVSDPVATDCRLSPRRR